MHVIQSVIQRKFDCFQLEKFLTPHFVFNSALHFFIFWRNQVRSSRTTPPLISVFSCVQVRLLFKAMEQNEKVEYLDLGDNAISDVGISYVADLLQAHI